MDERLLPTPEEISAYHRRKAEEAEFDTGLHSMGGPEPPTPEWVRVAWQKAAAERTQKEADTVTD